MSTTHKALADFQDRVRSAGETMGTAAAAIDTFLTPQNVIEKTVSVDGTEVPMYRVQFNNARGPYKGGIRFHHEVNLDEVTSLAGAMAIKTAVVGVPMGGGKGGAQFNPKEFDAEFSGQVARAWATEMADHIGVDADIPAPDVNTNPGLMAAMLDAYETAVGHSEPGVITGKPIAVGGSLGRGTATAQGGVYVLMKYFAQQGIDPAGKTVLVQGFGNAGSYVAKLLHDAGLKIVGASDSRGGIYNADGIDPYVAAENKANRQPLGEGIDAEMVPGDQFVTQQADILVLAALEGAVTADNADDVQATVVLELANNPTTEEADAILAGKDTVVIPDVLANAGGVTVSYFEWVQNRMGFYWTEAEVQEKLKPIMEKALAGVEEKAQLHDTTLRKAAYILGLGRILEAMRLRGRIS